MDKVITYIGDSNEIAQKAIQFLEKYKLKQEFKVKHLTEPPTLTSIIDYNITQVLIIEDKVVNESFLSQLLSIRKSALSQTIFVSIVIEDNNKLESHYHYFRSGVNLFFNRDGDFELFLTQLVFQVIDDKLYIPKFAQTRNAYATTKLSSLCFLDQLNEYEFIISSDIPLHQGEEDFFTLFESKERVHASPVQEHNNSLKSFTRFSSKWEFQHPSNWESSELSNWDTLSTQIEFDECISNIKKKNVLFIETPEGFQKYFKELEKYQELFNFFNISENTPNLSDVLKTEFDVIIIGDTLSLNSESRMDFLYDITMSLKSDDFKTMIIVSQSPSKSNALTKACRYDKILAFEDELELSLITKILEMLKIKTNFQSNDFHVSLTSPSAVIKREIEVIVTSLSEFFITFTTPLEIPLYSILTLDIGIELPILTTPPFKYLSKIGDKQHYMGFIFGMSENQLQLMRKAINYYLNIEITEIKNDFLDPIFGIENDDQEQEDENETEEDRQKEIEEAKEAVVINPERPITRYKKGYYTKL